MSIAALHDLPAPAKLNLFLHVTGRRADGYHLLQSAFALIDWCDTLHLERRPPGPGGSPGGISRTDLGLALPDDDLSVKAARLLQQASGTCWGVHISIDKQVPWGAGLGGGSSDAATTLLALNRLWGLRWPRQRLLDLALRLGADVPFFVGGHNAWVEGIGERLTPIDLPASGYLVVKPDVEIPTVKIFTSELLTRDTPATTVAVFAAETKRFGQNDLQACAQAYSSKVTETLVLLEQHMGNSRMSGSGSAVFAHTDHPSAAEHVVATLPAAWVGRYCEGMKHHPLCEWASD
ncbi:4-diphosphocytidyl-2-C-methyl-D-erythritol kinase [Sphaerotilus hippei]|uniref:4-diphosphocytidyl-2-C-methyl-D-erythritol kinase n=1 Tax=Sphaerotilus hippei TaxID=744406 RepID=A0A318H0X4_9BURK|nr:4-(cytidine 5'-diphospho)-2-C-methyl-D-erythritol kinase [Sphaerotilus hippei]PXW94135.1 4-diphosphocytidyl-2-C-methyl-D-erythritol kinase [Sphaerotilus hippei]